MLSVRSGELAAMLQASGFSSASGFRQQAASGITTAHDQNISGLGGGDESQACVLRRPVSAPSLRADVGRLAPVLLASFRPIDA